MNSVIIKQKLEKPIRSAKKVFEIKSSLVKYAETHLEILLSPSDDEKFRLNLLLPNINRIYGGASTAISFFNELSSELKCEKRIISFSGTKQSKNERDEMEKISEGTEIVVYDNKHKLDIRKKDVFISTAWYTATSIEGVINEQNRIFNHYYPLVYLIQDYEPGFYRWGTEYSEANRSYQLDIDTIAVFNSNELENYFINRRYDFFRMYSFKPVLNDGLKKYLFENKLKKRENIILFYGRPSIHRNAFSLIVESLRIFSKKIGSEDASNWTIYSVGEKHRGIKLSQGMTIISKGKLSIEEYADLMLKSKVGISLMMSPHPSYPPLEMSTFGLKTITNTFEGKDLGNFNDNIISLQRYDAEEIANTLIELIKSNTESTMLDEDYYTKTQHPFSEIIEPILSDLREFDVGEQKQ